MECKLGLMEKGIKFHCRRLYREVGEDEGIVSVEWVFCGRA